MCDNKTKLASLKLTSLFVNFRLANFVLLSHIKIQFAAIIANDLPT